jgi:hypothetical protein
VLASFLPGLREIRTPLAVGYSWLLVGYLVIGHNFPKSGQATGVMRDVYDVAHFVTPAGVVVIASVLAYLIGIVVAPLATVTLPALPWWASSRIPWRRNADRVEEALDALITDRLADRVRDEDSFRTEVLRHSVDIGQSNGIIIDRERLEELLRKDPEMRRGAVGNSLDTSGLVTEIEQGLPLVAQRMRALDDRAGIEYDRLRAGGEFRAGMAVPLLAFVLTLSARGSLWWLFALAAPALLLVSSAAARRDAQLLLVSTLAARRYDDRMVQLLEGIPVGQILSHAQHPSSAWAWEAVRTVRALAVSPDATVVAAGTVDGPIHLWDTRSGDHLRTLSGHRGKVSSLAFSADGQMLVSGGEDQSSRVWEVGTGAERQRLEHEEPVVDVAANRDGVFVIGTRRSLNWMYREDQKPSKVTLGPRWLDRMALDPDSKLLAVALDDGTLRVYVGETPVDLATYEDLTLVGWSGLNPYVVGFTRTAAENELRGWDPLTGRHINPATVVAQNLRRPALSQPQGTHLAVADEEDHVLLLDVESGETIQTLAGHRDSVTALAWSSNGDLLASAADDGTVIVWDIAEGHSKLRLVPPAGVSEAPQE